MGLGGTLGSEALDRWGPAGPSAEVAANVTHLRTTARSREVEASAAGRTATALEWFTDFMASTERTPFVDPSEPEGAHYNNHTLVLFAEFVRQCGSRQRSRAGTVIRADTIAGYVSAVKLLRSRETGCDGAPE
eukprot:657161-Pleurochrysis_carterae.AAC.1